jgi:aspartate 1-decarboxylase
MKLRTFVQGKIHRLKITALKPGYNGSCLISPDLMETAGIAPFERVELYSLTTQARIATYVFPGARKGEFTLNGGAALHFQIGDEVVVVAYRQEERFTGAQCVIVDPADNTIAEVLRYEDPLT